MAPIAQVQSNNSSNTNSSSSGQNATSNGGKGLAQKYLNNCRSFYSCIYCRTHLANHDELVSRSFQGNRSRAYLFNSVVNISSGPAVQRELNTGSHAVADIFCSNCSTTMGWKYEKAYVETQKYKEGKYIIELAHVVRENRHLEFDKRDVFFANNTNNNNNNANHHVQQQHQSATMFNTIAHDNGIGIGSLDSGDHFNSSSPLSNSKHGSSLPAKSSSNDEEVGGGGNNFILAHDEEEEELMFPFYDDICSDRSSYPSFSSWRSNQNRVRRSLYLDSTPYDWKYSASAASNATPSLSPGSPASLSAVNQVQNCSYACEGGGGGSDCSSVDHDHNFDAVQQKSRLEKSPTNFSNFALAFSSSSSPSMSASDAVDQHQKQHRMASAPTCNNDRTLPLMGTNDSEQTDMRHHHLSHHDTDNEIQFNFEADPLPMVDSTLDKCSYRIDNNAEQHDCDHNNGPRPIETTRTKHHATTSKTSIKRSNLNEAKQIISNSNSNPPQMTTMCKTLSSIGIDDEEFYDCCDEQS